MTWPLDKKRLFTTKRRRGLQQGIAVAPALLTALQPSDEITGSKARYLSLSPTGKV
jgi:hypothetical protein